VLRRLGVSSIPMSVLVDATGRVVRVYRGYDPAMVRDIERHLEGMIPAGTRSNRYNACGFAKRIIYGNFLNRVFAKTISRVSAASASHSQFLNNSL